ncbi:hypothetical protein [Streptomyces sp. NPDC051219]|uniref:hypothetical protein n=1 Tax=Streptomyces sp. NPDC051219 TaxID=3155283 RepID=UPI0034295A7F
MSSIVKFFAATKVDALDALNSGPDASFRVISFGNFDAEEALLDWESHFTGRSFEALVEEDIPEVVAESDGGPAVFLLSDSLLDAFSSSSTSQIEELAQWWVNEKAESGMEIDLPVSLGILRALVELTRQEREPQEGIYCWTS